jgi:integrase
MLPEHSEASAYQWLQEETARVKCGVPLPQKSSLRFCEFAASLLEKKVAKREIKSARGLEKWNQILVHLIQGTERVAGFGDMFVDAIAPAHVDAWHVGVAQLVQKGTYSPHTINGWVNVAKVVFKAMTREFGLARNPAETLKAIDTSEHPVYTEEEPNALTPEEVAAFLEAMRDAYPQHYAMTCLGFFTGLRPSSLRALRRKGETPDVRWDESVLLVRRSHTLGTEVMNTTKTGVRQRITVPKEVTNILQWHVDTQLTTKEQLASTLLFPREDGNYRSESSLKKAFAAVCNIIGLTKRFTPRGMRRTFNDLARVANVESMVTKSISGHLTDRMKDHYSTVSPAEQRESIGRVLRLVKPLTAVTDGHGGAPTFASGAPGGAPIRQVVLR